MCGSNKKEEEENKRKTGTTRDEKRGEEERGAGNRKGQFFEVMALVGGQFADGITVLAVTDDAKRNWSTW